MAQYSIKHFVVAVVESLSCVWLFETPLTVACQAPLSREFSRQEYWSQLPFHTPSKGSSWPRNWTHVSCVSSIAGGFFTMASLGKAPFNTLPTSHPQPKDEETNSFGILFLTIHCRTKSWVIKETIIQTLALPFNTLSLSFKNGNLNTYFIGILLWNKRLKA